MGAVRNVHVNELAEQTIDMIRKLDPRFRNDQDEVVVVWALAKLLLEISVDLDA